MHTRKTVSTPIPLTIRRSASGQRQRRGYPDIKLPDRVTNNHFVSIPVKQFRCRCRSQSAAPHRAIGGLRAVGRFCRFPARRGGQWWTRWGSGAVDRDSRLRAATLPVLQGKAKNLVLFSFLVDGNSCNAARRSTKPGHFLFFINSGRWLLLRFLFRKPKLESNDCRDQSKDKVCGTSSTHSRSTYFKKDKPRLCEASTAAGEKWVAVDYGFRKDQNRASRISFHVDRFMVQQKKTQTQTRASHPTSNSKKSFPTSYARSSHAIFVRGPAD
jgi:hypothetical protein